MLKTRSAQAPTELIIAGATALLGLVLGAGAAFGLWSQLHHTAQPALLTGAVAALAAGLVLVGLAVQNTAPRLFLMTAGISLAMAFFTGASAFAALVS
jgi:hypothetical protein